MTFQQELKSWMSPLSLATTPAPEIGSKAPISSKLSIPNTDGRPTVVTFLRHCGCPFAEKTFVELRNVAEKYRNISFVAISHSDGAATEKWVNSVGGAEEVKVIVDSDCEIYAQWGLGVSSAWHVLNPWSMYAVYELGKKDNIWNRPTESGSRWQTAGTFAVDGEGVVKWAQVARSTDDLPDFDMVIKAL